MIDYLEKLFKCTGTNELWDLHCEKMAEYGFDRLIYGFSRFTSPHSIGNLADLLLLSNHSQDYLSEVLDGLYHEAPMVKWMLENEGACSWSEVKRMEEAGLLNRQALKVWEINVRHGVLAGYTISFPDASSRSRGGIGLCARPGLTQDDVEEIWRQHGRELIIYNSIFHMRVSAMPHAGARKSLTPRQREALEWVADGKTTADVATLMGLTVATVEKHLRLARDTLEVETTAQAVMKATIQKQIFLTKQPFDGSHPCN